MKRFGGNRLKNLQGKTGGGQKENAERGVGGWIKGGVSGGGGTGRKPTTKLLTGDTKKEREGGGSRGKTTSSHLRE